MVAVTFIYFSVEPLLSPLLCPPSSIQFMLAAVLCPSLVVVGLDIFFMFTLIEISCATCLGHRGANEGGAGG